MSCKCHRQDPTNPELVTQYRDAIAHALEECALQMGKLREKIEEAIHEQNADLQTIDLVLGLSLIVMNLIIVNQVSNSRVLDLEKQMEELKKRIPVCDGK